MTIFDVAFGYGIDAVRLIDWWFGACGVDLPKLSSAEGAAGNAKDALAETEAR